MIVNQEQIKMLGSNTLFRGVSKDFLKPVIKAKNYFGVKEGTVIYNNGDESTDLYLLVEGEVKIKFTEAKKIEHKFITDFFGEEELLAGEKRSSCAVANHDCILYSIKLEELRRIIQSHKQIESNLNKKGKTEFGNFSSPLGKELRIESNVNNGNGNESELSSHNIFDPNDDLSNLTEDDINKISN
jgi:signal-transduction protein with cAMP-binding, CBS, and nucleotidyltransferase domain